MGKIGDLIVRLQLKYDDYKQGLKKAEKDTKGFGSSLSGLQAKAKSVWAAIAAAVASAAVKIAKDMTTASNVMEDKWESFTNNFKAAWDTVVRQLISNEWYSFERKLKSAITSAQYLTEALQDTTEVQNSIRLQKALMAEELSSLEILMRDINKTNDERLAAAEKYLNKVSPIYQQEIDRLYELQKANIGLLGKGHYSLEEMFDPTMMKDIKEFLILYGKTTKYDSLGGKTLREAIDVAKFNVNYSNQFTQKAQDAMAMRENLRELSLSLFPNQDQNFLQFIGSNYENELRGEDIEKIVSAIEQYQQALAAFNEETRKIQNLRNSLLKAKAEDEVPIVDMTEKLEKLPGIFSAAVSSIDMPDIIPDDWLTRNRDKIDAALAEAQRLQGITNEINRQFNDAVVSSLSGATQALTDCIMGIEGADASQVLAALLHPFAKTMTQLGEMLLLEGLGIKAFKESLKTLSPGIAIAAGASLIALGSALASGIQALSGASSSSSGGGYDSTQYSSNGYERYEQEITVHVVGEIAGDKIVLAGQKTLNKWNR